MPARRRASAGGVIRLIEANGSSTRGWEAAVAAAVRSVRDEVSAPLAVEVARLSADLDRGRPRTYRVAVKIAYRQPLGRPTGKTAR